jgi:FlaA1/EpsC-like NDP-sugar epimerase
LIGREPCQLDEQAIRRTISDRVVLITGAGGSIGSQLARIVAAFNPSRLVLVERSENALFEIDRELRSNFPGLSVAAMLHDVTHARRTEAVITAQKPNVIFHAAAHKHVPMMEDHPAEAVENNFYGTRSMADAAARNGVDRFVMISSDKAVNPSSVMGATKRLAELYIQYLNQRSDTLFSMVRFGNVLGSACSVIPIWSRQIAQGRPVTVTDRRMTRYFMTIPEAAGLVIQSAAFSEAADAAVFLLDMGEPVRIVDLARRFIKSMGLEPDRDVPIQFTGIRPGEKLFEELAYHGEDMLPTPHQSIGLWRCSPPEAKQMSRIIASFKDLRADDDHPWQTATHQSIISALRDAVPEMVEAPCADD